MSVMYDLRKRFADDQSGAPDEFDLLDSLYQLGGGEDEPSSVDWDAAQRLAAALQSMLDGVTIMSRAHDGYTDRDVEGEMEELEDGIKQQNWEAVMSAYGRLYYLFDHTFLLPLQHTNIIKTRSISLQVDKKQRPYSNHFVQLSARKNKNTVTATVLCTGNSYEPLRIYSCVYNLNAQLISCCTLN